MTTNATDADTDSDGDDDGSKQITSGQIIAAVTICFVGIAVILGTILAASSGTSLAVPDPGEFSPFEDDDDDNAVPYSESAQTDNETNSSDNDNGQPALLPGANENRTDGDSDDPRDDNEQIVIEPDPDGTPSDGADSEAGDGAENDSAPSQMLPGTDDADRGGDTNGSDEPPEPRAYPAVTVLNHPIEVEGGETAEIEVEVNTYGSEPEESGTVYLQNANVPEVFDQADYETERVSDDPPRAVDTVTLEYETQPVDGDSPETVELRVSDGERSVNFQITVLPDSRNGSGNWTQQEREQAAAMIQQYYEGYLAGISMATDAGWSTEQNQIRGDEPAGDRDPWPLEEWNSTDEAFEDGMNLGADEGTEPIESDYAERNPTYNYTDDAASSDGDDGG